MTVPKSFMGQPLGATDSSASVSGEVPVSPQTNREPWTSPEGIDILPVYGPEHLEGLDALDTWPGLSPFLRGPYPTMYTTEPWTCLLYTSPSPRDGLLSRMPSSA